MATKATNKTKVTPANWFPLFLDSEDKNTTNEEKASQWVTERRSSMASARTTYEEDWTAAEQAYRVEPGTATEDWKSTHTIPLTHGLVETAVAEFTDSNPDIMITAQDNDGNKTTTPDKAQKMTHIFKYSQRKGNFDVEKIKAFTEIAIYGTSIWEEMYREDPRVIKEIKDVDSETGEVTYEILDTTEYNDVFGKVVNIWDFYIDEMAEDFDTARDCIKREVLPIYEFKRLYGKYKAAENVQPGGETEQKDAYTKPEGATEDKIEVLHYYNKAYDVYWIVANEVLINQFDAPIPFMHKDFPFAHGVNTLMPHKFYGAGMPKIIAGVQAELDTLRRMAIDRAKLNLAKVFLVSEREDLTDDDVAIEPGKRISVSDPTKAMMALEFSDTPGSRYREEELLKEDARYGTGVSNPSQAVTTGATATESAIVKEATLKRLRKILAVNEILLLDRIGKLRTKNIQQFYKDPIKVKKIIGSDGEEIFLPMYHKIEVQTATGFETFIATPEDVRGEFEFHIQSYSTIPLSQALEEQRAQQMYDRIIQSPVCDRQKTDAWLITKHHESPENFLQENLAAPDGAFAEAENQRMMNGETLPPTPNAQPEHTQAHVNYVKKNAFRLMEGAKDKAFTEHIIGELAPDPGMGGAGAPGQPPMPGQEGIPGMGGMGDVTGVMPGAQGSPLAPDMSFDGQQGAPGQSIGPA